MNSVGLYGEVGRAQSTDAAPMTASLTPDARIGSDQASIERVAVEMGVSPHRLRCLVRRTGPQLSDVRRALADDLTGAAGA